MRRFHLYILPVSGLISSKILTIPWPCREVQCLMGEPPPISRYCSTIRGVLRLAIHFESELHEKDIFIYFIYAYSYSLREELERIQTFALAFA